MESKCEKEEEREGLKHFKKGWMDKETQRKYERGRGEEI